MPVVVWAAVVFALSSIPGTRLPPVHLTFADKIAHLLVYGILGGLACRALTLTTRWSGTRTLLTSILLALCYGISDEVHQLFVPWRSFDGFDVVADVMGATLGAFVALRWAVRRRAKEAR